MRPVFFFILCFSLSMHLSSQENRFAEVDSFARTVRPTRDLSRLAYRLTERFDMKEDKLRAIFIWMTEYIRYDHKFYNRHSVDDKPIKGPKCREGQDCSKVFADWEYALARQTLRRRKGVCSNYAILLRELCRMAGLNAEVVSGYVKKETYQIGTAGTLDHAWNAVQLDTGWVFLDATWAAGFCSKDESTGHLGRFRRRYNEYYWLTPKTAFARNHFPEKKDWQALSGLTHAQYLDQPFVEPAYLSELRVIVPEVGILRPKLGDTLRFRLHYAPPVTRVQVNTNLLRNPDLFSLEGKGRRRRRVFNEWARDKQRYTPFAQVGEVIDFTLAVTDRSLEYIDILFDYQRVARFKVKVVSP